jgi:hypothetical protein
MLEPAPSAGGKLFKYLLVEDIAINVKLIMQTARVVIILEKKD